MTLFERVTYSGDHDGVKISIHMIRSLMSEVESGRMSVGDASSVLELNQDQSNDFGRVLLKAMQSSSSQNFASKVFGYLILANNANRDNSGILNRYLIESNFWSMIESESLK